VAPVSIADESFGILPNRALHLSLSVRQPSTLVTMNDPLRSILVGTLALTVAGIFALVLTYYRIPVTIGRDKLQRTNALVIACLTFQGAHFVEEYATRFYERFPSLLGLQPWSATFFVAFNVFWLIIWVVAAFGLRSGARVAFFPLWFLAIAMIANGIAHPMLAVRVGGYFPGLISAPVVGIAGVVLWKHLMALTQRAGRSRMRPSSASELR
jgi:hypothetical protein